MAAILTALSVALRAAAADDPVTAEQAADRVIAVVKAKDAEALKGLAAADAPDPWAVADALAARKELDAAAAFAKAAPRPDTERLPAYLAARRSKPDDGAARKAMTDAASLALEGKGDAAAAALDAIVHKDDDVLAVSRAAARAALARDRAKAAKDAACLDGAGRTEAEAAAIAERIGWLAKAALSYVVAGNDAWECGRTSVAAERWEKAFAVYQARKDEASGAHVSVNLGLAYARLGSLDKAIDAYRRAAKTAEKIQDSALQAVGLAATGEILSRRGELSKARETLGQALEIQRKGGDQSGAGMTLLSLGRIYAAVGEPAKGLAAEEEARGLFAAVGNDLGTRRVQVVSAEIRIAQGDYPAALALLEKTRDESRDADDKVTEAMALGYLGHIQKNVGDYQKALQLETTAQRMFEGVEDAASSASALAEIGDIRRILGDYAEARASLEKAQKIAEDVGDRATLAVILSNVGNLHFALADYARALDAYKASLGHYESMGHRGGIAHAHMNHGAVYDITKDFAKARDAHEHALAVFREIGDRPGVARVLVNLADVDKEDGKPDQALPLLDEALKIEVELRAREGVALTFETYGEVHRALNQPAKALEYFKKASAEADRVRSSETFVRAQIGTAQALLDMKKPEVALAEAKRAIDLMNLLAHGQAEEQGAAVRSQYADLYDAGARAAVEQSEAADAFYFVENGRAGTLLEAMGGRESLRSVALPAPLRDAEAKARIAESGALQAYLRVIESDNPLLDDVQARRAEFDAARGAVKELIERVQRDQKAQASVFYPKAELVGTIQERLKPGTALVVYGVLTDETVAVVVTKEEEPRIVRLAKSSDVEAACAALVLNDEKIDPKEGIAHLRSLVVDRLGLGEKTARVLLSPDGALSYVPFALLLGTREVAYVPSGTTLEVLAEEGTKRGEGVLALGDPTYGVKPPTGPLAEALERGGLSFGRLAGTRKEVEAIGTLKLLGKDATESGLRAALATKPRWHAVHFACHGIVDPERPTLSALAITPDDEDDGLVTAMDVFQMRIPTDLAVLSACETGKGKIVRGEGIVGLTRAFMAAGAPRVIVSLWKVDDAATHALMEAFYARWKAGTPTAKALLDAQNEIQSKKGWEHPKFWAAWVLWGLPD